MASRPSTSTPPVGKSGPGIMPTRVSVRAFGVLMRCSSASQISPTLWGGMDVAMPTAMPLAPFASRFGKAAGRTSGSSLRPS